VEFYFVKKQAVKKASPQRLLGAKELISKTFIISLRVLFFLSATPFDSGEYGGVTS